MCLASESEGENVRPSLEAAPPPVSLGKPERYLALTAALGSFLASLDASAVNTVLPLIRGAFHTTIPMVQWVILAELLGTSGLLLGFGRLGDQRGHKRIYLAGFRIFLSGCVFCAAAPGVVPLIAFRVIQGIGSAMLLASSPALLVMHLPTERRGQALGLRASLIYLGLAAGPAVGGWLAGRYGWRAVFFMELPVGLLGLTLTQRLIRDDPPATYPPRTDFPGAGAWTGGLAALLFGLNRGNAWGWTSPPVLLSLLISAMLLMAFLRMERGNPDSMVDLTLFDHSQFSLPVATLVLNFVSGYLLIFLLPFYLIQGRHMRPAAAGLLIAANGLIRVAAAPLSGRLSDRIGPPLPATFGAGMLALGAFLLSRLTQHSSMGSLIAGVLIAGFGIGIFVPPNNSMLMGAVPRSRRGIASGILATSRTVGMGVGVALAGIILPRALENSQKAGSPEVILGASAGGFAVAAAIALLTAMICAVAARSETTSPP
jgi:EmrB/QacA subfamily drug resistance transporter